MAKSSWTVELIKAPRMNNVYPAGFFPVNFHYKADGLLLVAEVKDRGGVAALVRHHNGGTKLYSPCKAPRTLEPGELAAMTEQGTLTPQMKLAVPATNRWTPEVCDKLAEVASRPTPDPEVARLGLPRTVQQLARLYSSPPPALTDEDRRWLERGYRYKVESRGAFPRYFQLFADAAELALTVEWTQIVNIWEVARNNGGG